LYIHQAGFATKRRDRRGLAGAELQRQRAARHQQRGRRRAQAADQVQPVGATVERQPRLGLDFAVDARVLVPRPDTESLVDEAIARLRPRLPAPDVDDVSSVEPPAEDAAPPVVAPAPPPVTGKVADIGTGSGAVIVTP